MIAALLVLSLTACGKSKSTNSVPLVDCSDRGSAVEGGCYLMTEETPDEICEEAKVIFSENLSQWVSVFEGDAGEYVLGTPYHTHLRPDNTDVYSFPVLCNGEFWRILSIYKTRRRNTPSIFSYRREVPAFTQPVITGESHPFCLGRGRSVCRRREYRGNHHA